jgi:4'-phosphopantetheinyl transferase
MVAAAFSNNIWPLPPEIIELNDNEVHVWMIPTLGDDSGSEKFIELLSADERQRAARFKFDKDRRLYVAAHAGLRSLLADYVRVSAHEIDFVAGAHGKPLLAQPGTSGLEFNLSHSHELALIVVARGKAVGVDVEFVKKDFAFGDLARRFFTAAEVAALFELPPALQRKAFFKCWTSKEAFLKAKATGLSGKLDEVQIVLTHDGFVRIDANVPGWSLAELIQGDGYEAALVVEGDALPIRCYRWDPVLNGSLTCASY